MIQDQMNSKKNFFKTFLNLIKDSRPNKFLFFILLISFILIPSSITSLGVLIKNFIDHAFQQNQGAYEKIRLFSYLNQYTIYFICLSIILAFASSLRIFAINYLNDFLALRIKERIFKKILNFDLKTYDQYGKNFFKTLLGFEIEEVISAVNLKLSLIARNIGLFIGSISLLFFSNLKLSLIIILSILFVLFFISIMGIRLRKSIKLMKEMKNKTFLYIDESITFIKLIKIFNQNQRQLENLTDEHKKILQNVFWVYIFRGIFIGFIIICLFFTIILTIYFGSMMILNGEMTPGTLSSFIFYALISSTSLGGIIESFFEISKYRLNFDKIQNILECNNDKNESGSQIIEKFQSLEFKNIYFGYNNENCFLKDLNFRVKNKEKISIIGPSGSGKSTILNLIFGFFKPNSGSILINDINLSNINLESYYKKLSILSQEVEIFSISLFENFTYGCDNFDEKFLWHLIEIFNLKDFIQKLKDGIHTRIGDEEGAKLSGGQKQRVGLIRALLRKPEILILDEFTSSLDSQNEANIYEFLLSKECENICVIFVTHKLFYLDKMNKIIKLSNSGEIEIISNQ